MPDPTIISGNIFRSQCQTLVNTVNCVGVMGAGIALEFKLRHPKMFEQYARLCSEGKFDIGLLWIYKNTSPWVLNFPTKKDWKNPSREAYLHAGLEKFMATYKERGIQSIAFPLLGAQKGGIPQQISLNIMCSYLKDCEIPVEIYCYDPLALDDLYLDFKERFLSLSNIEMKNITGLKSNYSEKIRGALLNPAICQLNQLAKIDGIGERTLEKAYSLMQQNNMADISTKQILLI